MSNVRLTPRRNVLARELGIELPERFSLDAQPWHTVVCSRLGKDLLQRRFEIFWIRAFIEKAMQRGERTLVMDQTASHPWAQRACELLGQDPVRLSTRPSKPPWLELRLPDAWCRDKLAIELADRVDATFVRPSGTIMRLLCQRLERDDPPSVQLLVSHTDPAVHQALIARGAIGYWINRPREDTPDSASVDSSREPPTPAQRRAVRSLIHEPEKWLIHSTRKRTGPWPGQSTSQFQDWLLLSTPTFEPTSALETLSRIVSEQRLIGRGQTTAAKTPVVCLTAMPIDAWLARRCFRPHLGRWDCEPYGVAIRRDKAIEMGVEPVVYGDEETKNRLPADQRWRFQAIGETYDWTEEQEWRAKGGIDLSVFDEDEAIIFTQETNELAQLPTARWPRISGQMLSP